MRKITGKLLGAINLSQRTSGSQETNEQHDAENSGPDVFFQRMLDRDVYLHISEISVAMVGVCLTGVSILQFDDQSDNANTYVDDLLALDSFVFLTSCLLAYWSVRVVMKGHRHVRRVANIANLIFLLGMILMAIVCGYIALQGDYSFGLSPEK
jgi:magnesium-transporting ATPase (P-type)